ncbi:Major facilitator superfamily domain general substrate transporter [Penicillium paradoxum]|uniref:Major facilitator superfamily domain general substrate transporter n=1 Tax=Penicillium paradoxum TaxID=176176 RepID=UPI00254978AC|nr:Major facilitator superfamily domain general substrate transporter [Penicillium paradoxum]KAJ5774170.1 Major facilitator superfamily domain general substrate transporter [Penicillium paradoxum]
MQSQQKIGIDPSTVNLMTGIFGVIKAVMTFVWLGTEFFDPNFRSLTQAATAASNWLFNFLISRFTEQMFAKMHYGVYFFAALSFLAFFFVFFLIP